MTSHASRKIPAERAMVTKSMADTRRPKKGQLPDGAGIVPAGQYQVHRCCNRRQQGESAGQKAVSESTPHSADRREMASQVAR
jgi:hypothetical protein